MGCELCQVLETGWQLTARVCALRKLLVVGWRLSAGVCALTVKYRTLKRDLKRKCVDADIKITVNPT
jgi:hypothetical protein